MEDFNTTFWNEWEGLRYIRKEKNNSSSRLDKGREIDGLNQEQTPLMFSSDFCKIVRTATLQNTYEETLIKLYFANVVFVSIMSNMRVVII